MKRTPLISLLTVALLAGCGSDSSDRAGGKKPVEAKVLTMANVNGELGELEAFDEAVGRVSGPPADQVAQRVRQRPRRHRGGQPDP